MRGLFQRKTDKATKAATFVFSPSAEGGRLELRSPKGLVAPVAWLEARPEARLGIEHLQIASEDGAGCIAQDDGYQVSAAFLAELEAHVAADLDIPAPTNLGLDLKSIGRLDQDDFCLKSQWVRPGGQPVRAELVGAILKTPDGQRRLPEPLWSIFHAAQALSKPLEKSERFRAVAELREKWPDGAHASVESDAFLKDLRVYYASSLSLRLRSLTPDHTEFDPVLFGGKAARDAEAEGRPVDEEIDSVLTPAAQKIFSEDRFRREGEARAVYPLREGEYVFIDPALRPVLNVVRRLQDGSEADRREFILNPRRILQERIGETNPISERLDELFIETDQFSSRVAGVDVWRAPVLPWLTPLGKNQWLPERFGIRVGDDYFGIKSENLKSVVEAVSAAASSGAPLVDLEGLLDPVDGGPPPPKSLTTSDTLIGAVKSLEPLVQATNDADGMAEAEPQSFNSWAGDKLFLIVRENFEEVEYASIDAAGEAEHVEYAPVTAPKRLRTTLKPHQVQGLGWLANCARTGRPGALLADDMGLGKTLQAIAFMAWLQEEAEAGRRLKTPFLIVAPTGLLGTWRQEILHHLEKNHLGPMVLAFGSDLKTLRDEGGFSGRDIETGRASLKAENWLDAGVVLTTYETMRDYHFSFARTRFGLVVYDEIQKLKNPTSQMTRAAKALNAAFTLGMTGTPVENRLQDLWSIMDVISPGLLGASRDFERRYAPDDVKALAGLKRLLTASESGRPAYMLRRMKSDALEGLPAKHVHRLPVDMPKAQAEKYQQIVFRAAASASSGGAGKGKMLATLAALRGVSLHPVDPGEAPADLDLYVQDSARLSHTLRILEEVAANREKALVFVEDLAMQERLAGYIQRRFKLPSLPMRINGTVPGPRRQAMVTAFQQNRERFDVMILSPKAGGVGLTLTSANHVIHLSRWWNPAVEDQATDRVFRIGQGRDVHVYLPLSVHPDPTIRDASFDLRLDALIDRKRRLTQDLFLPPDPEDAELTDLFREVSLAADVEALSEVAEGATETPKEAAPAPVPDRNERKTLTLKNEIVKTGIRRFRSESGQERPIREILSPFVGREIAHVTIRDPYAIAHVNSRRAQVRFLSELNGVAKGISAATIEYAPDIDGFDDALCRRSFGEIFAEQLGGGPKLSLQRRRRRATEMDFHDRRIELDVVHAGGSIMRHEIDIGRGLEALFDISKQCTVTYVPPVI